MVGKKPLRPEGPAVCLAQAIGLGIKALIHPKGQRPGHLRQRTGSHAMPQSHAQVWLHIVFSTKERRGFLQKDSFHTTTSFQDEYWRLCEKHGILGLSYPRKGPGRWPFCAFGYSDTQAVGLG
jgi:hypothetical protein